MSNAKTTWITYSGQLTQIRDYKSTAAQRIKDQMNNAVVEAYRLHKSERPTRLAGSYASKLIDTFSQIGISDVDIWPTNNATLEFARRIDSKNQFIVETGDNGISGFVRISGVNTFIESDTDQSELVSALRSFVSQH